MRANYSFRFSGLASLLALAMWSTSASAVTINVDGSNHTTLSSAVAAAYAADDGADIINLNVDSLPTADGQILLDKPITINGDGNNNDIQCDLLVDMTGIIAAADIGGGGKAYIEISSAGDVTISEVRMHPNADGTFTTADTLVGAIRIFKPLNAGETGNYTFTKVYASGSDSSSGNAYVSLETGADLYNQAGVHKWGGLLAQQDGNIGGYGVIQLTNAGGAGIYNTVIDHCQAGLSYGAALNIPAEGGFTTVLGGLYGHCGRDGIRASGTTITLQGTSSDRLRVVRNTNIAAANSHSVEVLGGASVPLMEYVDVAGCLTANGFNIRGGTVEVMRFCRALGKLGAAPTNHALFLNAANPVVLMEDCTIHGQAGFTAGVQAAVVSPTEFRDSIFTNEGDGVTSSIDHNATTGTLTYTNCAIPIDGEPNESLPNPPFTGNGGPQDLSDPSIVSPVLVSPDYLLTLADYDWSAAQGSTNPLNGPGNANVLRPSNASYLTAASGGTPLTGGAGPLLSGIESGTWMLME